MGCDTCRTYWEPPYMNRRCGRRIWVLLPPPCLAKRRGAKFLLEKTDASRPVYDGTSPSVSDFVGTDGGLSEFVSACFGNLTLRVRVRKGITDCSLNINKKINKFLRIDRIKFLLFLNYCDKIILLIVCNFLYIF